MAQEKKIKGPKFDWSEIKICAIVGEPNSGKTACAYTILDQIKNRKKYVYRHPTPEILEPSKIENLGELNFGRLVDCALWIDEPQLIFRRGDVKSHNSFLRLYSLARQRDIILILSTSDTRWFTVAMESYIDTWVIKDLDFNTIKRGSTIKEIIKSYYHDIFTHEFHLECYEALLYCRKQLDGPKKINIPLPKYWNDQFSKPYKYVEFREEDGSDIFQFGDDQLS